MATYTELRKKAKDLDAPQEICMPLLSAIVMLCPRIFFLLSSRFYPTFSRKSVRRSGCEHKNAGRARLRVGWVTRHGCFMADSFVCSE